MGWVSAVQTVKDISDDHRNDKCVAALDSDARIATVAYSHLRGMRYQAVGIPGKLIIKRGDRVAINIADCTKPMALIKS